MSDGVGNGGKESEAAREIDVESRIVFEMIHQRQRGGFVWNVDIKKEIAVTLADET